MGGGMDRQQTRGQAAGVRELTAASRKCHSSLTAAGSFWMLGGHSHPWQLRKTVSKAASGRPCARHVG